MAKSGSGIDNWEIEGCMLIEMGMYFKSSNSKLVYKLEEKRATARRYTRIFLDELNSILVYLMKNGWVNASTIHEY